MPRTVFKILRPAEWRAFAETGAFAGSPDDIRDGFIHLSLAEQVTGTLEKHFAQDKEIVLAAFEDETLGSALKYERSRGGALFPHLHGVLRKEQVTAWARITRGYRGFELPDWCKAEAAEE